MQQHMSLYLLHKGKLAILSGLTLSIASFPFPDSPFPSILKKAEIIHQSRSYPVFQPGWCPMRGYEELLASGPLTGLTGWRGDRDVII